MNELRYAYDLYEHDTLRYWTELYLKILPEDVKTLVVCSSSGVSLASAMCLLSTRPLNFVVIRKPEEDAHTRGYVGDFHTSSGESTCLAIVDDFMSTGKTVKEIIKALERQDKLKFLKYVLVSCIKPKSTTMISEFLPVQFIGIISK